jgi:3-oxoacyl-[acyl-carrier protein] reductase
MSQSLKGKVALVTGASRGLGKAIAISLGKRGASVAVNYYSNLDLAESVVAEVEKAGGTGLAVQADVLSEDDVQRLADNVRTGLGPIDIVVANATGPQPFIPIEEQTWECYLDQLNYFVKSPLLLMKQVVADWKSRRYGRFINIGSEVFEMGVPMFANYVCAKGGQYGLTRSWARELAQWDITVNHVSPGWIPTERHTDDPQQMKDEYAAGVPMKRMGVPADIGEAVAFLASDEANFITGQKLTVNGGHTLE